jgi:GNAT superfamily N-acetyltransferase
MGTVLRQGSYEIDDNPARVDFDAVWRFLSADAYWARWRSREDVRRQVEGAWRVVGCYDRQGRMVGFARALSDGVALAYIADVYVLTDHRGRGLGQALLREMIDNGPGRDFRWMLHTDDAHGLYRKFGFAAPDSAFMERVIDRNDKSDRMSDPERVIN